MNTLFKNYHPHPNGKENEKIKFIITFQKGIGYKVTVIPVKISLGGGFSIEEFGAYIGFNVTLLEVKGQSKKRLEAAINILITKEQGYLEYFKQKEQ